MNLTSLIKYGYPTREAYSKSPDVGYTMNARVMNEVSLVENICILNLLQQVHVQQFYLYGTQNIRRLSTMLDNINVRDNVYA